MGNPFPLKQNAGKSFQGSIVLGKGFVLTPEEAQRLIAKDPRNKDVLFPYLNGDDLNNDPEQKPSRWVINFFDWSEEKARTYPDCFEIVERLVKPERLLYDETKNSWNKAVKTNWWQFGAWRKGLDEAISKLDQVMVLPRVSKYLQVSIAQRNVVYSEATVVLALDSFIDYGILSSSIHDIWAWKYSSTMKGDALRYSASGAFETFPFPLVSSELLGNIGFIHQQLRKKLMVNLNVGLTTLQNLYHNSKLSLSEKGYADILELRDVFSKMDNAVLNAYGWKDIELKHDFYEVDYLPEKDRVRFTIQPSAKKEILSRLLKLNYDQQNYQTEIASKIPGISKRGTPSELVNLFTPE